MRKPFLPHYYEGKVSLNEKLYLCPEYGELAVYQCFKKDMKDCTFKNKSQCNKIYSIQEVKNENA